MVMGLIGKKCGMTRVFTDAGVSIPVTVLELLPNRVVQLKTEEKDGYRAVQLSAGRVKKANRVSKPRQGHFAKASVEPTEYLREFRLESAELSEVKAGDAFTVEHFKEGQSVDVTGTSKGKGFAGVIKRHNFTMQRASHGNSLAHRAHGSTGQCQTPGRVFKGKRMAGQMGNVQETVQNQVIVKVDVERHLILVKGAVPGAPGGMVIVRPSIKAKLAEVPHAA